MKPPRRYRFLPFFAVLMLAGLSGLALVNYLRARDLMQRQITGTILPLVSQTIDHGLEHELLQPVLAASLMARNNLLVQQLQAGEADPVALKAYLRSIQERLGATTAFLVSNRTLRYYHPTGALKRLSPDDPQDRWYFRFRDSGLPDEINIDRDTADLSRTTAFVNVRLQDPQGKFLGAIGLGIDIEKLTSELRRYQQRYGALILLVDRQGRIRLAADHLGGRLASIEGLGPLSGQILRGDYRAMHLPEAGRELYVSSRTIPELGWVLVILQPISPEQRHLLNLLAQNLAAALIISSVLMVLAHLTLGAQQRQLERLASTDSLTGLFNRTAFATLFEHLTATTVRRGETLAVVLMDIDHFKQVNDRYGHPVGDRVLCHVGSLIKAQTRQADLLFRWGGEEFLLLLPACGLHQAEQRLEELRRQLHSSPLPLDPSHHASGARCEAALPVTASFGLTAFRAGESSSDLLQRADMALYAAKRAGRDRVSVVSPG